MKKRRILSVLAAVLLLLTNVFFTGCAGNSAKIPEKTDAFYYLDESDVLDTAAENRIKTLNDALFALTGAQVVIAAVDTTAPSAIGVYAAALFDKWGIGSVERQNGLLLLLATEDENYYLLPGEGLREALSDDALRSLMNEYLEPDFANKQYGTGALLFFEAIVARLAEHYDVSLESWDGAAGTFTSRAESAPSSGFGGISLTGVILIIVAVLIIILIIIMIIGSGRGRRRRRRRIPSVQSRPVYRQGYYPNARPAVRPPSRQNPNNSGRK